MKSKNITYVRDNFYQIVAEATACYEPITIVNSKGKNAVLISEEDWNDIQETLYLSSIPGYVDKIKEIDETEDWDKAREYKPGDKL